MKTKSSSVWMFTAMAAMVLFMASCGNSQKKKEKAAEKRMSEQPMDTVTFYESETVVVVDSLDPQKNVATPEKTK